MHLDAATMVSLIKRTIGSSGCKGEQGHPIQFGVRCSIGALQLVWQNKKEDATVTDPKKRTKTKKKKKKTKKTTLKRKAQKLSSPSEEQKQGP